MMRDKVQVIAYLPISSEGTSLEAIDLNDVKVVAFRISTIGTKMKIKTIKNLNEFLETKN